MIRKYTSRFNNIEIRGTADHIERGWLSHYHAEEDPHLKEQYKQQAEHWGRINERTRN